MQVEREERLDRRQHPVLVVLDPHQALGAVVIVDMPRFRSHGPSLERAAQYERRRGVGVGEGQRPSPMQN
jgi:hypothetical protein